MNFQMFKLDLEKGRGTRDQIPNIHWITKKQENSMKTSTFASLTMLKPLTVWITTTLWRIFQEKGLPDHLTRLLINLYAGQGATVRTGHGTTDWFQIGKGVSQSCTLSLCLLNLYTEYIMQNAKLDEVKAESRLQGEISIISDMQIMPPLWQKVKKN